MPESDLELLKDVAKKAGEIAGRFWKENPKTWDKPGGAGPVTEADLAVDQMLRETLLEARPDYGWLSEETEDGPARLSSQRQFIIDPIDGTRAFIDGSRSWAHSLAVVENGKSLAGVVYLPMLDKLYTATVGQGAQLNGTKIAASARAQLSGASVLAGKPTFQAKYWPRGVPEVERHFRPSLAYRLCLVAEGSFDAMIIFRDSWDWDIAAGALIASEAGAVMTDREGAALTFNSPSAKGPGVLAMAPNLARPILNARGH